MIPVPFPYQPNGGETIRDTVRFSTGITKAFSQREQRRARRFVPDGEIEFTVAMMTAERATQVNGLLWAHQADQWLVPLWPYATQTSDVVSAGDVFIPITPPVSGYGLEVVPWAVADAVTHPWVMIWRSDTQWQIHQLDSIASVYGWGVSWGNSWGSTSSASTPGIIIVGGIEGAGGGWGNNYGNEWDSGSGPTTVFPAGAIVVPMRTARLDPRLTASPEALESASGRCVWTIEEVGDRVGGPMPSPETPYLGAELVTRQPGRMLRPDEAQSLAVVELDNTSGVRTVRAPVRQPAKSRSFEMPAFDLGAAYEARRLMYQQVGMQRAFWIPSWQRDLPIAAAAIAGATTIAVHECGYATNIFPAGVAKRHVVLRSPSGASVQARKVTNATTDGSTETLTLDTPLSAGIDSSTLAMFLRYVRFDADEMTFEWDGRATFVALPVVDLSEETPA